MRLFDPDPRLKWLFCFTHPDDEIFIAAWMRRLAVLDADIWATWSVSDPVREAESRRVMDRLGIFQNRLRFFGLPDKAVCDSLRSLTDTLCELLREARPDRIALCAFECGHIDHDATNFAVRAALERLDWTAIPMLEMPLYHTYAHRIPVVNRFADPAGEEIISLSSEERRLKREVRKSYPSQKIGWLLFWYSIWRGLILRGYSLAATERMRPQTHFDYLTPNLPEPLRSRVRQSATWTRWRATTDIAV